MMGRTHVVTGACVGCWYAAVLPAPDIVRLGCAATVSIAATFPDIDHHKGMVTTAIWPITNILSWLVRGAPFHLFGWEGRLWPGVRHRGTLHRPRTAFYAAVVACALGGIAALLLSLTTPSTLWSYWWAWGIAVGLGWAAHLAWDARTHSGLPVGRNRHWRLGNPDARLPIFRTIRTGSPDEVRVRLFWFRAFWVSAIAAVVVTTNGVLPWTR
jgi:hypothetical protein